MALATRPKSPVHHKKRQAGHHRHSKRYLKTYWPYLPMLLIVVFGFSLNNYLEAHQRVLGTSSNFSSSALLQDTNNDRQSNGESPLSISPQLMAAAQAKAEDMAENNYWSHTSPNGETPWDFINSAGYSYQLAGENLAYGFSSAAETESAWMNSPEHRANILTGAYQNVGFGIASSPDYQNSGPETIIVAEYAEPVASAAHITFTVNNPRRPLSSNTASTSDTTELSAQPVSRIQLLTQGKAIWSALVLSAISGAALVLIIIKYGIRFKRAAVASEAFIVLHPFLDILLVLIITVGFVFTRSAGFIR